MEWALFFPLGTEMSKYFCLFRAHDHKHAEKIGKTHYPDHFFHVVPNDRRFQAVIHTYKLFPIALGQKITLSNVRQVLNEPALDRD